MSYRMGLVLLAFILAGCGGVSVKPTAERVQLTGNVTIAGKPADGVTISLLPTEDGLPCTIKPEKGKYEVSIVPGKYTYHVEEGSKNIKSVPEVYHQRSMERQVSVSSSGGTHDFQLD